MPPLPLPNALIYLTSIFRPSILRPHLKVPSIAHVDFRALRKEGYNAVVIDKDNCLTIPYDDSVYPQYQTAWNDLLETFSPGRVLVVSNSAGTTKDPGGIAAEALSLSLRAPVLLHSQPKPGCAPSILSYFSGRLGTPTTKRKEMVAASLEVREEERADELALVEKWREDVDGPLLGPSKSASGGLKNIKAHGEGKKENVVKSNSTTEMKESVEKREGDDELLRIIVLGDRLFTDTLLAHRLSRYLPTISASKSAKAAIPTVISIHTTSLPEPKDVRLLRWIEERLTHGASKVDKNREMNRFILPYGEGIEDLEQKKQPQPKLGFIARRLGPLRWLTLSRWREIDYPILTRNPKSWRPLALTVGLGRLVGYVGKNIYRGTIGGLRFIWLKGSKVIAERSGKAGNVVALTPPTAREGQVM